MLRCLVTLGGDNILTSIDGHNRMYGDAFSMNDNTNGRGDEILVSIKDTGTGIHPEILPKLFTKFATKTISGGTGLGLFISKSIIEMHGGRIWATNNNKDEGEKGVGATITFSLPIKQ